MVGAFDQIVKPDWVLEHYLQYIHLDKSPFIIGRGADCGLTLALSVISRHHAEFVWSGESKDWSLRDLGSTNNTYVNDKQVTDRPHKVMSGDFIRFASVEVRLLHIPYTVSKPKELYDSKRTDVLGRIPDRTLSTKEKIERAMGNIIRQGNCSAQELADTLNVERSTLYRHMLQEFGTSPSALLRDKRLAYAAELLASNKFSVQQVASKTGFDSPAHFSRAFKKHFGVVPSHFEPDTASVEE